MQKTHSRKRLVAELLELIDADEAILALLQKSDKETYDRKEYERSQAQEVSNNELRRAIKQYKTHLDSQISTYGIRTNIRGLTRLRAYIESITKNSDYALIPKYEVDRIFRDYGKYVISQYESFPAHTRFGFHLGQKRDQIGKFEVHLLEQILHEDVCVLFNLSKSFMKEDKQKSKYEYKRAMAMFRACVVASFNFVECYLNAIAFDFLLKNKKNLNDKDRDLLSEFDSKQGRERFVSLRDKLLKYPKIILAVEHPVFTEANNESVKTFLDYAKDIRDTIVHSKPAHDEINVESNERVIYKLKFEEVEKIVDASTEIVRQIETLINPGSVRLNWLMKKNSEGLFDEVAFE